MFRLGRGDWSLHTYVPHLRSNPAAGHRDVAFYKDKYVPKYIILFIAYFHDTFSYLLCTYKRKTLGNIWSTGFHPSVVKNLLHNENLVQ
jgi:hypothetical protein